MWEMKNKSRHEMYNLSLSHSCDKRAAENLDEENQKNKRP